MTSRAALQSTHESVPVEEDDLSPILGSPILGDPARRLFSTPPAGTAGTSTVEPIPINTPNVAAATADHNLTSVHARDASVLLPRNRDEVVHTEATGMPQAVAPPGIPLIQPQPPSTISEDNFKKLMD